MLEENKKRIVIASILKPVNDTRMFGKIAVTLANTDRYEIHVAGFAAPHQPTTNIYFHSFGSFTRLGLKRLIVPWLLLKTIRKIRPQLLIITTHELLFVALLARLFYRSRIVYDVQENYFVNLSCTRTFPYGIKHVLAAYVRVKETLAARFIDHFFLAERAYAKELPFVKSRFTILENKVRRPATPLKRSTGTNTLLFTGTLAESTGVFSAIDLAVKLHEINPAIRLIIVGFASQKQTLKKIQNAIAFYDFIELIGGSELVPHPEIMRHIQRAGFGIIAYPDNPSTRTAVPTKLYEYLGYKLPILLTEHEEWARICHSYNAAVVFSPSIDTQTIHELMATQTFYTTDPSQVYWEEEEPKLIAIVDSILKLC